MPVSREHPSSAPLSIHDLTVAYHRKAVIWDVDTTRTIAELLGHEKEITALGFSADGKKAVTASLDQTVRIWFRTDK